MIEGLWIRQGAPTFLTSRPLITSRTASSTSLPLRVRGMSGTGMIVIRHVPRTRAGANRLFDPFFERGHRTSTPAFEPHEQNHDLMIGRRRSRPTAMHSSTASIVSTWR